MKQLITLTIVLLLSTLLALPALAAQPKNQVPQQASEQAKSIDPAQTVGKKKDPHKSEGFKRQQTYQEKRKAMKDRRDAALKVREQNIKNNSPGKTGL